MRVDQSSAARITHRSYGDRAKNIKKRKKFFCGGVRGKEGSGVVPRDDDHGVCWQ